MNEKTTDKKPFCYVKGTVTVDAKGYWYTSGGDKGSFGYYPHLKKQENGRLYPVYPDTQIHGDLKMAALWLCELQKSCNSTYSKELVYKIFGYDSKDEKQKNKPLPSLVFVTDLELTNKDVWKDEYFQVKPRISIDDETRTNEEHMLVSLEMAFMNNKRINADIYISGHLIEHELRMAKQLLKDSANLLSGFGAFRSRGYGRGKVDIDWNDKTQKIILPEQRDNMDKQVICGEGAKSFVYGLRLLVNFRNKQIDPGTTQLLTSQTAITSEQLRAWFVKTYNFIYGEWPTFDELDGISFPTLYPSRIEDDGISIGYPPAMTTIRNEKEEIRDMAGRKSVEKDKDVERDDRDNFFSTKTKPLLSGSFVTDEDEPVAIEALKRKRIRNSTSSNFATIEDGLFVQEYIYQDTSFGGVITIADITAEFSKKARFILKKIKPVINGCLFESSIQNYGREEFSENSYLLVTRPIEFSPDDNLLNFRSCGYNENAGRMSIDNANQITLSSVRGYNTTLCRPRKQRIVVAPGSVICKESKNEDTKKSHSDALLRWKGFGKDFKKIEKQHEPDKSPETPIFNNSETNRFNPLIKELLEENFTRAQAGIFREFMNQKRSINEIKRVIEHRIEKYREKNRSAHEELYTTMQGFIDDRKKLTAFINYMLDGLYMKWWEKKNS